MLSSPDPLKTLSNIAQILQKSQPSENPLAHIVMMVRQQMKVDVCSLYLLQEKTLILVATDGLDTSSVGQVRMQINEGLTGLAIEKLQPIIVNEASRHPRFKYFPETGEEKFHSFAAVPLLNRDKVVGALTIQTALPREFSFEEIEVLKLIAFQLAAVIQNLVALEILQQGKKTEKDSHEMKGIPVAPGFGIGPGFFLRPGISPVILSPVDPQGLSPKEEGKKLKMALKKASDDLRLLEKKLTRKFSKKEADIFYSHRMILSDPTFLKKLKSILKKGKTAVEAVTSVIGEYIRQFEKIEDPHFRERSADLEDLRQRILEHLVEKKSKKQKEIWAGVLVAETLVPSHTAQLDSQSITGIVTERGGLTSHAAILARSLGIPAVMGLSGITKQITPGDLLIVDGNTGKVYINPSQPILREYEKIQEQYADRMVYLHQFAGEPASTQDGHRIRLEANIGLFSDLQRLRYFGAEGVGLYRTELPFMTRGQIPGEEEQFRLYRDIVEEIEDLPVTFRVLDAGGDKPLEALGMTSEPNPFLGYRSIRLSLSKPEILEVQFRALLRASAFGPIRILIPMISGIEEIRAVKSILEQVQKELTERKVSFSRQIPFGIMIEMPSAVNTVHLLVEEADFLSIGTNDLIQYTLAVDRNNERVAAFFEPLHPAVLASIAHVAQIGKSVKKQVGICGEIAGDPFMAPLLVGLGITQLSMIPSNIPLVKRMIRQIRYEETQQLAEKVLKVATVQEVKNILEPFQQSLEKD